MDDVIKNAIYDILVEECNAPESLRDNFLYHFPECREYRFQGNQGFGGKVWFAYYNGKQDSVFVSCYPEDEKFVDNEARVRANNRLKELS